MKGRIRDIIHKDLHQEIRKRLDDLEKGKLISIEPNTVAVLYFRNIFHWRELDPILKGLAEFLTIDLKKVRNLQLVERIKLQVLLDELKISPNLLFDQVQTPKVGRLLSASEIIAGGIERLSNFHLQLNAGVVVTETGQLQGDDVQITGSISDILNLEKKLVLELIYDFGIKLSEAEYRDSQPMIKSFAKPNEKTSTLESWLDFLYIPLIPNHGGVAKAIWPI